MLPTPIHPDQLGSMAESTEQDTSHITQPFVSVIIPVFNDPDRLTLCLAALEAQSYDRSCYEVIVVDNGSTNPQATAEMVALFDHVILATEKRPGSYAARNRGVTLAQGMIIAFTDADCVPAPDWLAMGVDALLKLPNGGIVAGNIKVFPVYPHAPTPVELYEMVTAFPQQRLLSQYHYGATGNLFTWRQVLNEVGMFNDRLKSNGDVEWGQRVFNHGYQQIYAETVCVYHPARRTWTDLYKRTIRLAGGSSDLKRSRTRSSLAWYIQFWVGLLPDLVPPLAFVVTAWQHPDLHGWKHKLQACAVMFFVRYVTAWEKLRLFLGGKSARE